MAKKDEKPGDNKPVESLEDQVNTLRQQLESLRQDFLNHQHERGGRVELHQGNPIAEIEPETVASSAS